MAKSEDGVWGPFDLGYVAHSMAVSAGAGEHLHIACSSFLPEAQNFVDIFALDMNKPEALKPPTRLPHHFPASRVRWLNGGASRSAEVVEQHQLLGTSGDYLRVWNTSGELLQLLRHESNPKGVCTPITSFDSAMVDGACTLASCDVYGICTLWDLERGTAKQAFELGQPLEDIAFGPHGLLAVAGEKGDCFFLDPRQPQDCHVVPVADQVSGPARMAWGDETSDVLAISWQGQDGGVALYGGCSAITGSGAARSSVAPAKILRSGGASSATIAALQWSPAYPELLCCAKEDGFVEVWQFPTDSSAVDCASAVAAQGPCFKWEPRRGEACTAMALTPQVRPQRHYVALATMPQQEKTGASGSLWVAGLPEPPPMVAAYKPKATTSDVFQGPCNLSSACSPSRPCEAPLCLHR